MQIYLDGKLVPKEQAKISVFDHGLLYGDGVFEGIRAYNGRIFKFDEHINRLYNSARAIRLEIPISKDDMKKAIIQTLKVNEFTDAYIRVVVTRGIGDLGLDPDTCTQASYFIITDKLNLYPQDFYDKGLEIITCSVRRNIPDALNPRIKSLNYLNNIMGKIEAKRGNVLEAVMLNKDGFVTECTGDNIFVYSEGVLKTPPNYVGALQGITRDTVIDLAKKNGIKVSEEMMTQYELYTADECFLTGTGAEIMPVVKIDDRLIGEGKPGVMTASMIDMYRQLVKTVGVEIK